MRWLIPGMLLLGAGCGSTKVEAPVVLAEGEGAVRVQCLARPDGRLTDCKVLSERPAGQGFGEAALRAAGQARIDTDMLRGSPGVKVEFNMRFRPDEPATLDLTPPRA
jgi:TonB family protein